MKKTDQINLSETLINQVKERTDVLYVLLNEMANKYPAITFASSFGAEDVVLHHAIHESQSKIAIFSLDTGRLPNQTFELISTIKKQYDQAIEFFFPNQENIERYMNDKGVNAFYESLELRKECCYIRKVEPLKRALKNRDAWITGMRASQSQTRLALKIQEHDSVHGIAKINPLTDWTDMQIWAYIKLHGLPYNSLHDEFYPSIGCAPCTRAVSLGEDIRAGRWWLENPEHKECGLHLKDKK